jgi:heme exporter protein D
MDVCKALWIWLAVAFVVTPLAGYIIHKVNPTDEGDE